jgi:hypothetical protein
MPIDQIRIQSVRGIRRELMLDLGGASLILRGDNGTGKSSIVAGLVWALTGEQEPLEAAKAGTEDAYRAHILDGASASRVEITLAGGGALKVTSGGIDGDPKARALRESCIRSTPFLLRRQLLQFLNDRPVDRFRYLEAFLDLGQADETREAIQARSGEHENLADAHRRTHGAQLRAVTQLMPPEYAPAKPSWVALVDGLIAWSKALGVPGDAATWDDLVAQSKRMKPLLEGENLARSRVALEEAQVGFQALPPRPIDPSSLLEKVKTLMSSATDASMSTLLEEAAKHFAAHEGAESCPVCRQGIDKTVADDVRRRVSDLTELHETRKALTVAGSSWRTYWTAFGAAVRAYTKSRGLEGLGDDANAPRPPDGMSKLNLAADAATIASEVASVGAPALGHWCSSVCDYAKTTLEAALKALPTEDNTDGIRRFLLALEQATKAQFPVAVAEAGAQDESERAARFKAVSEAIRAARQDVAQALLTEISSLVSEFYTFVHPPGADDEVTGAPEIEVQRRSGGSAHVRGTFHAKAVDDPRWVYSDGHLDTVGICVFLALRRFRADRDKAADPKLMILDDIVLSVDLVHGRRLLDLLKARFSDHQVLIFTHNGLFCDWCAQRLPTYKRKAIARWSLKTGPQLGEYLSSMEYIEQQIASATSPKLLAQAVMNLMDEWLGEARFEYKLPVQAQRGEEYTLNEIWEPFCSRLKEVEKAMKVPIGRLKPLLDELADLPKMRNRLAAHDNEFAREYPLTTVRETAQRAVELVRTLYCSECSRFAVPTPTPREPDLVRCGQKCERIRYVRPSKQQPVPG